MHIDFLNRIILPIPAYMIRERNGGGEGELNFVKSKLTLTVRKYYQTTFKI